MTDQTILKQLKIQNAHKKDWNEILNILEETSLTRWFTGGENYKNFYIVKDPQTTKISSKILCCFSITTKEDIAILKSFAVRKDFQGKGIGKIIANKTIEIAKKLNAKKIFAASSESPGFWKKTIYTEINLNEIKEPYYLSYVKKIEIKFPTETKRATHYLALID